MKGEVVIIPTYKRNEHLFCCLRRIRLTGYDGPIAIFPDRNTFDDPVLGQIARLHSAFLCFVPEHSFHGNTYNTMEAYRWAYNAGFEMVYLVEDDVLVHNDFFDWHRKMHEDFTDIFGSMAWVFNRHAPILDDETFQPWFYSVGVAFRRPKLRLIVEHASPAYYADMPGYIERAFRKSKLNTPFAIEHYEQDGLIQRVLDADRSQTVSAGIAKCSHLGNFGYNRDWSNRDELFRGCKTFNERVARLEVFINDPYWRAEVFDRDIVEREIGRKLEERMFRYRITFGEWSSEFESPLSVPALPKRINSVPVPDDAKIMLVS